MFELPQYYVSNEHFQFFYFGGIRLNYDPLSFTTEIRITNEDSH